MVLRSLFALSFGIATCCFLRGDEPKQKVQVRNTEHMDFTPSGLLTLKNSTGELIVEGWDQPGIEITTIKSTKEAYSSSEREKAARELDQVHVKTERHGDELVITTDFPRHRLFPPPTKWGSAVDFDLEYEIKVPRNARLTVNHNIGEVHVDDLMGDIHATARQGEITLHLADSRQYAVDAKSDIGDVISDFPGNEKRKPWPVGHQLLESPANAAQRLFLRTGFGDIILLKIQNPAAPAQTVSK